MFAQIVLQALASTPGPVTVEHRLDGLREAGLPGDWVAPDIATRRYPVLMAQGCHHRRLPGTAAILGVSRRTGGRARWPNLSRSGSGVCIAAFVTKLLRGRREVQLW